MLESAERLLELRFSARAERLQLLRRVVRDAAEQGGFAPARAQEILLAVSEACANIIQHAYGGESDGEIRLSIYRRRQGRAGLLFLLQDDAPCIDPRSVAPRDLAELRPGGLGVHFIRQIMDEVEFLECKGRGNRLLLTKYA